MPWHAQSASPSIGPWRWNTRLVGCACTAGTPEDDRTKGIEPPAKSGITRLVRLVVARNRGPLSHAPINSLLQATRVSTRVDNHNHAEDDPTADGLSAGTLGWISGVRARVKKDYDGIVTAEQGQIRAITGEDSVQIVSRVTGRPGLGGCSPPP